VKCFHSQSTDFESLKKVRVLGPFPFGKASLREGTWKARDFGVGLDLPKSHSCGLAHRAFGIEPDQHIGELLLVQGVHNFGKTVADWAGEHRVGEAAWQARFLLQDGPPRPLDLFGVAGLEGKAGCLVADLGQEDHLVQVPHDFVRAGLLTDNGCDAL